MLPLVLLRIASDGVVSYLVTLPALADRLFVSGMGKHSLRQYFSFFWCCLWPLMMLRVACVNASFIEDLDRCSFHYDQSFSTYRKYIANRSAASRISREIAEGSDNQHIWTSDLLHLRIWIAVHFIAKCGCPLST